MRPIQQVRLKDVFGFKDVDIEFPEQGCFLILGNNLDDPGSKSNDSGKSAFLDAISWVLSNQFPRRKVSMDRVIREGQKQAVGSIKLEGGWIERVRGANTKQFTFPGHDAALTDSQRQQQFAASLGVKDVYQYIMNAVYFNFAQYAAFADPDKTSAERLELFSDMFRLQRYVKAGKLAGEHAKTAKDALVQLQNKRKVLEAAVESAGVLSADARGALEKQLAAVMAQGGTLKAQIAETESALKAYLDLESKLTTLRTKAMVISADILDVHARIVEKETLRTDARWGALEVQIKEIEARLLTTESCLTTAAVLGKEKDELNANLSQITSEEAVLQSNLAMRKKIKNLTCPKCAAALGLSLVGEPSLLDANDVQDEVAGILASMEKISAAKQAMVEQKAALQKRIEENEREKTQRIQDQAHLSSSQKQLLARDSIAAGLIDLNNQLNRKMLDETGIKTELETCQQSVDPTFDSVSVTAQLSKLRTDFQSASNTYHTLTAQISADDSAKTRMAQAAEELTAVDAELQAGRSEFALYTALQLGFPKVRNEILSRLVPTIQTGTNAYLTTMDTDVKISFNVDTEKTVGAFDLSIYAEGRDWPYDSRGRGKRTRIAVATALSIRDLYMKAVPDPLGFLFMDEVADHMDEQGVINFFELLKTLPGQLFVISHNDVLQDLFDNVLVVEKANGVSSVRWLK